MNGIASYIPEAEAIERDVRHAFGALTPEQLEWTPAPGRWSVGQCLEHLIVMDAAYWPVFERIERGEHRPGLLRRLPLLARMFGALVHRAVLPESTRRFPTSPAMNPSVGSVAPDVVGRFAEHQHILIAHMRRLGEAGAEDVPIPSPIAAVATYSVRDAIRIVVAHQRRHVLQARRVTEAPGFPASRPAA